MCSVPAHRGRCRIRPVRYFAYGSNMLPSRLHARIGDFPSGAVGVAQGYQLRFHKRGSDGSAKCNALWTGDLRHVLYGAVYHITEGQKNLLDQFEGVGYVTANITVNSNRSRHPAFTYVAAKDHIDSSLYPFDWYKRFVLAGARDFKLPNPYIRNIELIAALADPDRSRSRRNLMLLERKSS